MPKVTDQIRAVAEVPPELRMALVDGLHAIDRALHDPVARDEFTCRALGCLSTPSVGRLCDYHQEQADDDRTWDGQ